MNQEKIWDEIAEPWQNYRKATFIEAIKFLKKQKGNVLDLGCGPGKYFVKFPGTIYAVDFSKKMLELAESYAKEEKINVKLFKSSLDNLLFEDNFFNAAIFIAALHCVETGKKRENAVRELFRVLKPNAEAIVTVWDKDQKRFRNKPKENYIPWTKGGKKYMRYYYLYDKDEIVNLFKKTGFEIIKIYDKEAKHLNYSQKNIILRVKKP